MTTPNKTAVSSGELMIGNWIEHNGIPTKLLGSDLYMLYGAQRVFHGIPITPNILDRCGFERLENCHELAISSNFSLLWYSDKGMKLATLGTRTFIQTDLQVKYIHHLQNLYLCLYGEQLNVDF